MRASDVGLNDARIRHDIHRLAAADHRTIVEREHAVTDADDDIHVVLDEQDCHATLIPSIEDEPRHVLLLFLIHSRHRLVENEEMRIGGKRTRELDTFLQPNRNSVDKFITHGFKLKEVDDVLDNRTVGRFLGSGEPPIKRGAHDTRPHVDVPPKQNVVEHAHAVKERQILEGARHAKGGDPVRCETRDVVPVEKDLSALRRIEAGNRVDQRGFPTAIRTDQTEDLAAADAHIDAVECNDAAEMPLDIAALQHRPGVFNRHRESPPISKLPARRPGSISFFECRSNANGC